MTRIQVVEESQAAVALVLREGDFAIDATVGNGGDTEFLCRHVGPHGLVLGVDIQQQAVEATRRRLAELGLSERARLVQADHSALESLAADLAPQRKPTAVMFNLGYLPGGDKSVVTRPESTVEALRSAAQLIVPGGIISIVVYRGHEGARDEAGAVEDWIGTLPRPTFSDYRLGRDGVPEHRPYAAFVRKEI